MNLTSENTQLLDQYRSVQLLQSSRGPVVACSTEYYESDGCRLALDVYLPDREAYPGLRPSILFFFGGGFRVGWRKAFQMQAEECAKQGYVAFSADYRVKALYDTTPWDSMTDGACAWNYVRQNVSRWQVDPKGIFLSGGSAGGLIALMCGRLSGVQPAGLILFNPAIADGDSSDDPLSAIVEPMGAPIPVIDAGHPDPDMGPALILHGEADQTVPIENIRKFISSCAELGRDVTLKTYPNVGHGFFNFSRSLPHFHLTTGELLLFLRKAWESRSEAEKMAP